MNTTTKSSATKYLLVVLLILIIFGITAKLYVNFSKIPLLKSVNNIVEVKSNYSKLDSCIFKLYNAENSFRMYVVSGNRKHYLEFNYEIKAVTATMDFIEDENQKEVALTSESFNHLISQKKIRTDQFILLKHMADSLMSFSSRAEDDINQLTSSNKLFTSRQFKSIIKIDTLKPGIVAEPKKKLFGRIFAAINDKGKKGIDSSKSTIIKTTVSADTSSESMAYNKLQLKTINDFYLKLYKTNLKLKDREKELLEVNHRLIFNIVDALKQYKSKEKDYYATVQQIVNASTYDVLNNLDNFTILLVLLLIGLLLFVFYTIFKLYKNEKALVEQSNKASLFALSKSRFLANMSHEIRTPLNSIVGFSEQLSQGNLELQQKEQIGAIRNSSVMLLDVVNDILDFSKYETGKVTLESVPFSPQIAIKDVFDSMKIQADKKKIGFVLEDKDIDQKIFVLGDPLRLKQVVMNLLSNAIKFTTEGSVTLSAKIVQSSANNALLKVSVIDTGMGINQVDQRIIFDEFAQVYYSSTKEKQQGTGLGLAICKKIVEFQGGSIGVTSEVHVGSTFIFELPYEITSEVAAFQPEILIHEDLEVLKGKRVLLADDNMLNILLASTILKKYNVVFDAAYDGKEALDLFNEHEYDVVITDIQMPEMGGIELTRKIRSSADAKKAATPILGVTANVMQEDRTKYLQSGMNELVLKPFLEHELLEKILKFLK